ncbi:MAG: signal peptidase II [Dehalococcoidia bacterium]|nr:signal peptidase II [Dehalococcoidia bacterium]
MGKHKPKIFLSKDRRKIGLSLALVALVIVLDQLTKSWIRDNLTLGESLTIAGRLSLTYLRNTGAVFGLFANQPLFSTIIILASLLIIFLFFHYLSRATDVGVMSASLILGGAVGNLIDRLHLGYVTDFIDFRLWGNFHWPSFNFADAAIVAGTLTFIYALYLSGLFRTVDEHDHKSKN